MTPSSEASALTQTTLWWGRSPSSWALRSPGSSWCVVTMLCCTVKCRPDKVPALHGWHELPALGGSSQLGTATLQQATGKLQVQLCFLSRSSSHTQHSHGLPTGCMMCYCAGLPMHNGRWSAVQACDAADQLVAGTGTAMPCSHIQW